MTDGRIDWELVAAALGHGLVVLDGDTRIAGCNPAAERILGRAADALLGCRPSDLRLDVVAEDGTPLPVSAVADPGRRVGVRTADGERRWLRVTAAPLPPDAAPAAVVAVIHDVTDDRADELALRRLAENDDLTGLPNRRRFLEILDLHLRSNRREDTGGALLLLDLDRFKELNDAFGHAAGDRLLVQVAGALRERLRDDDVVARLGGDEFAVLLRRASAAEATIVAESLIERLGREQMPAPSGGIRPAKGSVGLVSLHDTAPGTSERALEQADAVMYSAKAMGGGGYRIHAATGPRPGVGEQLAKRNRQLALANAVGARLAGMDDAAAIAEATVEELRRAFGYHLIAVIRLRGDDRVEALAVRGAHFDALRLSGWSQPRHEGLIGRCLRERTPVLVNDVRGDPSYQPTPETTEVRAELVVPLLVDGAVWGALNLEELQPDAFDAEDVLLLSTLANQVGAALRAAGLVERLRERQ